MDLMQYLQDYGAGDSPEEESWFPSNDQFRQAAVPILSMADAMTGTLGSRLGAGATALMGGGGEGNFSNRYTSIMDRLAADKSRWQAEHPAMNVLSQVANVPGYVASVAATPGLSGLGVVPQALAGLGINRGLDELLGATLDDRAASQPRPSQEQLMASRIKQNTEPAGPNQNSPAGEMANFRVGNGEWQNGLDSRIGKNFSKGAPGSASAASERYRSSLEPNREDQIRQLYANTYEKIVNGYSKSISSITDPKSREAAMKQIGNLAHETAVRVLPPEYQADYNAGITDPNKDKPKDEEVPSTEGEGIGTLSGLALLLGGGAAAGVIAKKLGVPIPTAKAILQKFTGKGAAGAKEKLMAMAKQGPEKGSVAAFAKEMEEYPMRKAAVLAGKGFAETVPGASVATGAKEALVKASSASPASAKLYKKISELSDVNNKKKETQALTQLFRKGQLPPAVQEAKKGAKRHSYTPAVKRHSYVPKGK